MTTWRDTQIQWKTDAWKDPRDVAGYDERINHTSGWNVMKNRVETGLFARLVTGTEILDVGIGTGRASLPLARAGRKVTGVDSSEAMLAKCRELAGDTPIELVAGDVTALPFEDESFDTVMSLNTLAHFPHWQSIMREWSRVVRPGGQLIFDTYSLDHDLAFARATGRSEKYAKQHFASPDVKNFFLRITVEELIAYADELGLRVRNIIPYGLLIGSAGYNRFLDGSLISGNSWDRLLSWVYSDRKLFEFLVFLEEALVAKLTTQASCRFMVVFDAVADPEANRAWIARNREYNAVLTQGLSPATLARYGGVDIEAVRARLAEFLTHEPNRFTFARLLLVNRPWKWPLHLSEWIDDSSRLQLEHVLALGALDDIVLAYVRSLNFVPTILDPLNYKGIPLTMSFAYDLMSEVLDEGFDAFGRSFGGGA